MTQEAWPTRVVLAMAVVYCAMTLMGDFSALPAQGLPKSWGFPGVMAVSLAIVWVSPRASLARLVGVAVVLFALVTTTALVLADVGLRQALQFAVVDLCVGAGLLVIYGLLRGATTWAPTNPTDIIVLWLAAVVATTPVAFMGLLPGTGLTSMEALESSMWWSVRIAINLFVSAASLFTLWWFPQSTRTAWAQDARWLLITVPTVLAVLALFLSNPSLPISWMVLVPAVMAGMVLTPRGVAIYVVIAGLFTVVLPPILGVTTNFNGQVPPLLLSDTVHAAGAFLGFLIALFRYQEGQMTTKLADERQAVSDHAETLEAVYDTMNDGVIIIDLRGHIVLQNQAAVSLIGRISGGAELVQWAFESGFSTLAGDPLTPESLGVSEAMSGGRSRTEVIRVSDGGRREFFEVHITRLGAGVHQRLLVMLWDVTEEKLKRQELSSFAEVVAHDLRSPLTAVQGWLELLEEGLEDQFGDAVAAPNRRALAAATSGTNRLMTMINDWLGYTVRRETALHADQIALADLLGFVRDQTAGGTGEFDQRITIDAPHSVVVDAVLVRQVFANLFSNARKYVRPGVVSELSVTSELDSSSGMVRVFVRDNGIGIPPGEEERIFDEGTRAQAHAASYEGTGRGLALCRRVVQRHGGEIRARSNTDGSGSTFELTLPALDA